MPAPLTIAIPTTSISPPPHPYTLYHIHLTLPLRTHITKKRYSDFSALHSLLLTQTSAAPPAPLPPKSWFGSTVNNAQKTEERRSGLERYLQAIVTAEDGRWRASSAWRGFLDLPAGLVDTSSGNAHGANSNSNSANGNGKGRRRGSSINANDGQGPVTDPQAWLDVHRDVKAQIHGARQTLKRREAAASAQEQHALSAEAKAGLVRAATGIARLEDGLRQASNGGGSGGAAGWGGGLGEGEIRRRRDLLGAARKEVEGLEAVLRSLVVKNAGTGVVNGGSSGAAATQGDKEALWKGTSAGTQKTGRVLGGPLKETERTRELDNQGVLQLQKQVMAEQDQDVLEIGKAVSRMKEMGIMINEELVVQNEMLGLLDGDVDRVQGKIDVAKKRIGKIR